MADEAAEEIEDGEEADGEAPKKKLGIKKLALFAGLPVLILVLGGAAAFLLLSGGGEDQLAELQDEDGAYAAAAERDASLVFYELPELLVNINSGDGRPTYLKLSLTLELESAAMLPEIEQKLPRVVDQFQGFLRELRVEDLSGSAGSQRLRLELLRRINLVLAPRQANAVLIEEMLIQ